MCFQEVEIALFGFTDVVYCCCGKPNFHKVEKRKFYLWVIGQQQKRRYTRSKLYRHVRWHVRVRAVHGWWHVCPLLRRDPPNRASNCWRASAGLQKGQVFMKYKHLLFWILFMLSFTSKIQALNIREFVRSILLRFVIYSIVLSNKYFDITG